MSGVLLDALLAVALIFAWASVLSYAGRARPAEGRYSALLLLSALCALLLFLPWVGWLLALALHHQALLRIFAFPPRQALLMTGAAAALYALIRGLFLLAGS